MEKKYHDREWLYEQYITKGRTIKSICEECGVKHQSLERYLKRFDIRKFPAQRIPTADEICELHVNQGCGVTKIAEMYPGVGKRTILKIMAESGIKVLSPSELHSKWWQNDTVKKMMSEQRIQMWQNKNYREKAMSHLTDASAIRDRAIKKSASYQGVSVEEWNGFLTPGQTRIRNSEQYSNWRRAVFARDNYTCQCCGARSKSGHPVILHAHHLESFAHNEYLRFDINNGITLCYDCHDIRVCGSFHNLYGVHNNTRKQFEEFMDKRLSKDADKEGDK